MNASGDPHGDGPEEPDFYNLKWDEVQKEVRDSPGDDSPLRAESGGCAHIFRNGVCVNCGCSETFISSSANKGNRAVPRRKRKSAEQTESLLVELLEIATGDHQVPEINHSFLLQILQLALAQRKSKTPKASRLSRRASDNLLLWDALQRALEIDSALAWGFSYANTQSDLEMVAEESVTTFQSLGLSSLNWQNHCIEVAEKILKSSGIKVRPRSGLRDVLQAVRDGKTLVSISNTAIEQHLKVSSQSTAKSENVCEKCGHVLSLGDLKCPQCGESNLTGRIEMGFIAVAAVAGAMYLLYIGTFPVVGLILLLFGVGLGAILFFAK